jgi:hypothetical protein
MANLIVDEDRWTKQAEYIHSLTHSTKTVKNGTKTIFLLLEISHRGFLQVAANSSLLHLHNNELK